MATLKDLAAETGLTVTTVSRVLNNRGYISDDARKRVAEAVEKLNYHPNEMARSLKNKKTKTIGLIVPHIRHAYFAEVISELEKDLRAHGYRMLLCNSQDDEQQILNYYQMCVENRVAGVILCSGRISTDIFQNIDIPLIAFERELDKGTACVLCDNVQGGRMAAEYLLEKGCRKPLVVSTRSEDYNMPADERADSFCACFAEQGCTVKTVHLDLALFNQMAYHEALTEALQANPDSDSFFTGSDLIAIQALQVCSKLGIKVPEELRIVGFDGSDLAGYTVPTLTTIRQPVKEMAERTVELLLAAVEGHEIPARTILPVKLIPGESA